MNYEMTLPIIDMPGYPPVIYIEASSRRASKKNLETMAQYFKKEFGYDHLQYDEFDEDSGCVSVTSRPIIRTFVEKIQEKLIERR